MGAFRQGARMSEGAHQQRGVAEAVAEGFLDGLHRDLRQLRADLFGCSALAGAFGAGRLHPSIAIGWASMITRACAQG